MINDKSYASQALDMVKEINDLENFYHDMVKHFN